MEQSITTVHGVDRTEAFDSLKALADKMGDQVPQAINAGVESSNAYISAYMMEITSLDNQIERAESLEEKQILWTRRDAACRAIDEKDRQNKSYGLRVTGVLVLGATLIARCLVRLVR